MNFFDRQGILKYLLHRYDDREDGSDIDLNNKTGIDLKDSDMKFEDGVFTLTSYSLIKMNVKGDLFEIYRLVQFSTR